MNVTRRNKWLALLCIRMFDGGRQRADHRVVEGDRGELCSERHDRASDL